MASVKIPRPDQSDLGGASSTQKYIERLIDELEYILQNIDEDNFTESYRKKNKEKNNG